MSYTKSYGVQASNMYYTNESVVRIVNVSDTDETAEIFSDDTGSMEEIPSQPEKQTLYLSMADTSAGNAQMLGIVVPRTGGQSSDADCFLRQQLYRNHILESGRQYLPAGSNLSGSSYALCRGGLSVCSRQCDSGGIRSAVRSITFL